MTLSEVIKNQIKEFDKLASEWQNKCRVPDCESLTPCAHILVEDVRSFLTLSMQIAAEKAVGAVEEGVVEKTIEQGINPLHEPKRAFKNLENYGWNFARSSALQAGKKFLEG